MDPKPHSKTLADERTCWTKASHWSESQRIRPCFSAWVSDVLGKKSSSPSKLSANTASWTTVVDALWAMFQYQIKEPHVPFCRALRFIQITYAEGLDTRDNNVCASLHCHFNGIIQPFVSSLTGRQATSVGHVLAQLVRGERSRKHSCLRKDWNSQREASSSSCSGNTHGQDLTLSDETHVMTLLTEHQQKAGDDPTF